MRDTYSLYLDPKTRAEVQWVPSFIPTKIQFSNEKIWEELDEIRTGFREDVLLQWASMSDGRLLTTVLAGLPEVESEILFQKLSNIRRISIDAL